MTVALVTLAATWENPKKLVMRSFVLTAVSKLAYETDEISDVEVDDRKPWYHNVQRYLEHGEFSVSGVSRKRQKIGKEARRLPDLGNEEFTESVDVSKIEVALGCKDRRLSSHQGNRQKA